jgi:hypothetical protein
LSPHPAFGAKIRADFIQGMGKIGGKFVIILDIQRVLSVDEIASLATVGQGSRCKRPAPPTEKDASNTLRRPTMNLELDTRSTAAAVFRARLGDGVVPVRQCQR